MRSKKPALLSIITLTTVTILFWIAYEVYLIIITKPSASVDPKILEEVVPTLDLDVLDDLSQRIYFEEGVETNAVVNPPEVSPTPSPEITPTLIPTEPPEPSPEET